MVPRFHQVVLLIYSCSVTSHVQLLATPWTATHQASPVPHHLPEFAQVHVMSVMPSNHLILCCPLLLPTVNLSQHWSLFQWVGSSHQWPEYGTFSFSTSPSNDYSRLIAFRIDWFDLLLTQIIFVSTTIQNHQFFGTQSSLWSNSHIHTWLLQKPLLWVYGP